MIEEKFYEVCDICKIKKHIVYMEEVGKIKICKDCYKFKCVSCGNRFYKNNMKEIDVCDEDGECIDIDLICLKCNVLKGG